MNILVGYTGFVGSNIYARARNRIDGVFNSHNIEKAYGLEPELLIYAGLRAEKFLAYSAPERDLELILQAEENIRQINPKKLILISTIDVYSNPSGVNEESPVLGGGGIQPYGLNRYYLEAWVRKNYPDALIIRLPALYGVNIKKNFIYDFINVIPSMLKKSKYEELCVKEPKLSGYYELQDNGYYKCRVLAKEDKSHLRQMFKNIGFTALNFTDSRSVYQFYPLRRLWGDIQLALDADITLLNAATEPVSAAELFKYITGNVFKNELAAQPAQYDFKTLYADKFGGKNGYMYDKADILDDIKKFVDMSGVREEFLK